MPKEFYELPIAEQIDSLDENSGRMERLGVTRAALHYLRAEAERVSMLNYSIGRQLHTALLITIQYLRKQ